MEALYEITHTIAAMAVVCTLAEFILPKGKLHSSVTLAVGLLFVLAIATPIVSLFTDLEAADISSYIEQAPMIEHQQTHEDYLAQIYGRAMQE